MHRFTKLIVSLFLLFSFGVMYSASCTSTGNGAWNNPATWSCGYVPVCGDTIIIKAGSTVTVTAQQDYEPCGTGNGPIIYVYGTIKFDNGNKLRLPCGSIIFIFLSGSIVPGTGGGNSNYIEICDDIVWNAASGTLVGSGCLPVTAPGCGAVLPVELIEFSANINNTKTDVIWVTATEKNNKYFDIQRSADASQFEKIGTVNSQGINGNSQHQLSYFYEDHHPLEGVSYYRLKQVNNDQSYTYSKMVSVNFIKEKNIRFVIYPNPNNGEFTADISGIENNHEVKIVLTGESGQKVYESAFYINDPANTKIKIIPSDRLTSGMYVCTLIFEGIEYKVKVVVS